jgi:hypothetical protein
MKRKEYHFFYEHNTNADRYTTPALTSMGTRTRYKLPYNGI